MRDPEHSSRAREQRVGIVVDDHHSRPRGVQLLDDPQAHAT
jgi:hypothetical protein